MKRNDYETPSSEAFEVSLEGTILSDLENPQQGEEQGWDGDQP